MAEPLRFFRREGRSYVVLSDLLECRPWEDLTTWMFEHKCILFLEKYLAKLNPKKCNASYLFETQQKKIYFNINSAIRGSSL